MGACIIFVLILCAIHFDAKTLRAEDNDLYKQNIGHSPWFWPSMNLFFFIIISPIYLLRRSKFLKALRLNSAPNEPVYKTAHFSAIAEFMGVVLTWCFVSDGILLIGQVLKGRFNFFNDKLMMVVIAGIISDIVMLVLISRAIQKNHHGGFWSNVCFKKINGTLLKGVVFPAMLGAGFAGLAFIVAESKLMTSSPLQTMLSKSSLSSLLLFVGVAMITGPLFEEIFFRGYLFTFVSKLRGRIFTICFVASVFAVLHLDQLWGDWARFVIIFLMGLCVTFFRARSGSIIPGISAHYSYNISLLLIPVVYLGIVNPSYCEYAVKGKELDEAKQEQLLKQSVQEKPEFISAYNELAWLYAKQNKKLDVALSLIEVALRAKPQKSAYLDTKAEILFKMGRHDEAIKIEKSLMEKNPSDKFYAEQLNRFMVSQSEQK